MKDYSQELNAWAEELSAVHLPRWDELPSLNLYMDQVLEYINETLSFLIVQSPDPSNHSKGEDKHLTSAMINNYVKQKLIPKPEKKRYQRRHIACLIVYVLLKQVLPLTDIQKGIYLQLELCDRDFQVAYDLFCRQTEVGFTYVSDLTQSKIKNEQSYYTMPVTVLGTSMAALSLATKLIAQKVLALNIPADNGHDYAIEIETND